MDNKNRKGRATSSQMSRVAATNKNGTISKAFYTYAEEVAVERFIGRTSSTEVKTQPMKWGSLMEVILFQELGMGWTMEHKNTVLHPKFPNTWSGTPDLIAKLICAEVKCYEPKKFGSMALCMKKNDIQIFKEKFTSEYWQVVSNCILTKKKKAMIIGYMPKKKKLLEIIEMCSETDFLIDNNLSIGDYYFLSAENIESLPYLEDDSEIESIQSIEFDVPMDDIIFLTKRIKMFEEEVQKILK